MSNILNRNNLEKLLSLRSQYTLGELVTETREKLTSAYRDYGERYMEYLPTEEALAYQRSHPLASQPLISIVVPAYETPKLFLCQMVDSVVAQTYENWELCIADGSESRLVEETLKKQYGGEARIRYRRLAGNGGISENTNQGFAFAKGAYLALLDHDDLLVPSALYEMVKRANKTGADLLYSDEDKVAGNLERYQDPHFKLDFNGEMLLGNNYICHFLMFSRELMDRTGGLDSRYDGAQDHDFVLRCSQKARRIEHVARILYHWRIHEDSTAGRTDSKLYAYEAGRRAVEAALKRQNQPGEVTMMKARGYFQITYPAPAKAALEIQAWGEPSRSWRKLQRKLGQELAAAGISVTWRELLRPERYIDWKSQPASGGRQGYILRLNRGAVQIETSDVLRLLSSCAREGVKAVSGKVVSGGRVQNCGFYEKRGAYHPRFYNLPAEYKGYFRRAVLSAEVDAVGNDMTVLCSGQPEGRILVEPAAVIEIGKRL